MKRRVLLLLTALIVAAMLSVGPAFADGGNDCDWWDGHQWHHDCNDNGDDNGDDGGEGLGFLPNFIQNIIED